MPLLQVTDISKNEGNKLVLENIAFTQDSARKLAIAGESGAGKTSLLKIIAGLSHPDSGRVIFRNEPVFGPNNKLIPGHPGIAYLSQNFELRNNYRVEEILEYADQLPAGQAAELYRLCHIDHLLQRRTDQLSGGERQRIALARLLVSSPALLLLDEPYSNLDLTHKNVLKSVIDNLGKQGHTTCLLASHDPADTLAWADEIIVMQEGKIIQKGSPQHIYTYPVNEYAAALFGKYNRVTASMGPAFPALRQNTGVHFLRPEQFRIAQHGEPSIKGIVRSASYLGSHYELVVALPDVEIIVSSVSGHPPAGEEISLSIRL